MIAYCFTAYCLPFLLLTSIVLSSCCSYVLLRSSCFLLFLLIFCFLIAYFLLFRLLIAHASLLLLLTVLVAYFLILIFLISYFLPVLLPTVLIDCVTYCLLHLLFIFYCCCFGFFLFRTSLTSCFSITAHFLLIHISYILLFSLLTSYCLLLFFTFLTPYFADCSLLTCPTVYFLLFLLLTS